MKLSLKKIYLLTVIVISAFAFNTSAIAQCKSVVKEGVKKLAPYTHNGQVNNVTLEVGKPAEIHLSFYKGLYYKLQICSEKEVGKVSFVILDENNKEVYNSETAGGDQDSWSFYSNSSQDLVIQLKAPEKSKKGCAAVLVGMQIPHSNNPIRNL